MWGCTPCSGTAYGTGGKIPPHTYTHLYTPVCACSGIVAAHPNGTAQATGYRLQATGVGGTPPNGTAQHTQGCAATGKIRGVHSALGGKVV